MGEKPAASRNATRIVPATPNTVSVRLEPVLADSGVRVDIKAGGFALVLVAEPPSKADRIADRIWDPEGIVLEYLFLCFGEVV